MSAQGTYNIDFTLSNARRFYSSMGNLSDGKGLRSFSILRSVREYACPAWAALPKYLDEAIDSEQERALRIVLPTWHFGDAIFQSHIPYPKS